MYHRIGGVPKPGDQVKVDGLTLTVETTDGRRVGKVLVVAARERRPAGRRGGPLSGVRWTRADRLLMRRWRTQIRRNRRRRRPMPGRHAADATADSQRRSDRRSLGSRRAVWALRYRQVQASGSSLVGQWPATRHRRTDGRGLAPAGPGRTVHTEAVLTRRLRLGTTSPEIVSFTIAQEVERERGIANSDLVQGSVTRPRSRPGNIVVDTAPTDAANPIAASQALITETMISSRRSRARGCDDAGGVELGRAPRRGSGGPGRGCSRGHRSARGSR